jgi:hypothetical protein
MKTAELKHAMDDAKEAVKKAQAALKDASYRIMLTRMVADNIADLMPKGWEIKPYYYGTAVHFNAVDEKITLADLDKLATKLAKAFDTEPMKLIGTNTVNFTFYLYPKNGAKQCPTGTRLELTIGNTEKCEVETVDVIKKETKLTGYCAALEAKKYLTHAS